MMRDAGNRMDTASEIMQRTAHGATQYNQRMPDKAYKALKWVALIALPAVAWLVGAVGPQWGLPHCGEIVTTINAVGLFVGALIGVSQLTAAKPDGSDEK